jgi:hypothetical protein
MPFPSGLVEKNGDVGRFFSGWACAVSFLPSLLLTNSSSHTKECQHETRLGKVCGQVNPEEYP